MPVQEYATIKVPLYVWGRLASAADHQHCSVADLLVEAINSITPMPEGVPERPVVAKGTSLDDGELTTVWQMTLEGESIGRIMQVTGRSHNAVKNARAALGLVHVGSSRGGYWTAPDHD